MGRKRSFQSWVAGRGATCAGLTYDLERKVHVARLLVPVVVDVPKGVQVTPDDEDRHVKLESVLVTPEGEECPNVRKQLPLFPEVL